MMPGPTVIKRCPGCSKLLKFSTLASGNTFGAIFWTDGKCDAPMLPDMPLLHKSPSDDILFWEDECKEVGEMWDWAETKNPEWQDLEFAEEPTDEDYLRALQEG